MRAADRCGEYFQGARCVVSKGHTDEHVTFFNHKWANTEASSTSPSTEPDNTFGVVSDAEITNVI